MTGLNDALENVVVVKNYLYSQGDNWYADLLDEAADALALLKEQEAVEPIHPETADDPWFRCGSCGEEIVSEQFRFCPECGRKVLWHD